jgi:hypothetical protein
VRCDGRPDPRLVALRAAVTRLHRELYGHRADLPDRAVADEELAALAARLTAASAPEVSGLQYSLLVIAGALGSVTALGDALAEVRDAVERF